MHRTQGNRLYRLAKQCTDPGIRDQVNAIANEWVERAVAKGNGRPNTEAGRPELKSA